MRWLTWHRPLPRPVMGPGTNSRLERVNSDVGRSRAGRGGASRIPIPPRASPLAMAAGPASLGGCPRAQMPHLRKVGAG